jgi:hypothetical protein
MLMKVLWTQHGLSDAGGAQMRLYLGLHSPKISNGFSTPATKSLTTCLTPAGFLANAHYEVRIFWS